jgi:hypothetical protein
MATSLFDQLTTSVKGFFGGSSQSPTPQQASVKDFTMMPAPIQQAVARAKIVQGKAHSTYGGLEDIATVDDGSRDTITVRNQQKFQPQVIAHESTHLWQNSLPDSIRKQFAQTDAKAAYIDPNNFLPSIATMRQKGLKLENLSDEHQAQIMQAWYLYHGDKESKAILQPWVDDVTRIQNAADLENLLHKPLLPSSQNLMALYNGQKKTDNTPLNQYRNPEDQPGNVSYDFNKAWSKPGPYTTKLSSTDETSFQHWAKQNPSLVRGELNTTTPDYDMRGYWKAQQGGDPNAKQAPNRHFPDTWKTPYDATFSRESKYATPDAPHWEGDKLVTKGGQVVVDETPKKRKTR